MKAFQDWKAGLINELLLNEEVSVYDWSQGASECIMAKDYTPCCTSDKAEFQSWTENIDFSEYTECRTSPAYNELGDLCRFRKYYNDSTSEEIECPG